MSGLLLLSSSDLYHVLRAWHVPWEALALRGLDILNFELSIEPHVEEQLNAHAGYLRIAPTQRAQRLFESSHADYSR